MLRARSVYIDNIAIKINSELHKAAIDAINVLKNQIKSLYEYKKSVYTFTQAGEKAEFLNNIAKEVANNNRLIYESSVKVVEEATNIKTRDIT